MTLEHHYKENWHGCDATVDQIGNELTTWDVHIYYCEKPAAYFVYYYNGKRVTACKEHAEKWNAMGTKIRRMPNRHLESV